MLHKTVIATSVLAMAAVVAMAAVGNGDKASGHVRIDVGGGFQTYSFNAITAGDGSVKGHLNLNSRGQEIKLFGEVDCLAVVGNRAIVGGIIKRGGTLAPAGNRFTFQVTDNGEGSKAAPDTASDVNSYPASLATQFPAFAPCADSFVVPPPDATADANIQVKPGTP